MQSIEKKTYEKIQKRTNYQLKYFQEKYNLPAIQLVINLKRERKIKNIEILKAESFLKKL